MNNRPPDFDRLTPLQQALFGLKELRAELDAVTREPIALVGMSCRFPGGVSDAESFRALLTQGKDAIREIPPERWDIDAWYDPDPDAPNKMYSRWGGFLDNVDLFDAGFFGISPREAETMDPQQRILLEVAWHALENAGQSPATLAGTQTGVYVGISGTDWGLLGVGATIDAYAGTGTAHSLAAGRLSYLLGLQGPSLAIDTACSSSLVAIHLACHALRSRECDVALAGGVNLILSPAGMITFCRARMMAPDGRCKTFDAAADGYVRGEGCGVVVLRRLSDAVSRGDRILAVIRGSAVNQDGGGGGLTMPSGPAQEAVIRRALSEARVKPEAVGYVEAHGTGTPLGDPIELRALGAAVAGDAARKAPLVVGSVKTNIGHLEAAAGVAGLIRTVLMLQHREFTPHLHFSRPSPHVDWGTNTFEVPLTRTAWKLAEGQKRVAGVSAFSFSGTNAHIVLEEAPQVVAAEAKMERPLGILALSAKSEQALAEIAREYQAYLSGGDAAAWQDICFTAGSGRSHFRYRLAVVAGSSAKAANKLKGEVHQGRKTGSNGPRVAFLFTAQGHEYAEMGRELYETQPLYGRTVARCAELAGRELTGELALFALEYGLAELWRSWGIEPAVVAGQGIGEYAAACIAGVMKLEDALRLAALRGNGEEYEAALKEVELGEPRMDVIGPANWKDQGRAEASLKQLMESLAGEGIEAYIEIGPSPEQLGEIREAVKWLPSLRKGRSDWEQMLESLATLYVNGAEVDWAGFDAGYRRRKATLPGYPFQRQRYWMHPPAARPAAPATRSHPLLGRRLRTSGNETLFESELSSRFPGYLRDHRIYGVAVFPIAAYLEVALAAAADVLKTERTVLDEIVIQQPFILPENETRQLQLAWTGGENGFRISSTKAGDAGWTVHVTGKCSAAASDSEPRFDLDELRSRCGQPVPIERAYEATGARGLELGPQLRALEELWKGDGEALGKVKLPESLAAEAAAYQIHPVLLEGCLQVIGAFSEGMEHTWGEAFVPFSITSFRCFARPSRELWGYVVRRTTDRTPPGMLVADVRMLDATGRTLAVFEGLHMKRASQTALRPPAGKNLNESVYAIEWQPAPFAALAEHKNNIDASSCWLIYADNGGVGAGLAAALETSGEHVAVVYAGEGASRLSPADPSPHRELIESLAREGRYCAGAVYLWNLDTAMSGTESAQALGCAGALHLAQALARVSQRPRQEAQPGLWLVTRGAQPVDKERAIDVSQAPSWGLGSVIALEQMASHCTRVDLDPDAETAGAVKTLLQEIRGRDDEDQVAYRNGLRHAARLVRHPLPPAPEEYALRADAAYLVTGGMGGLGLLVAGWMSERGARHLVLLGRGAPSAAAQGQIERLRAQGVKITVAQGDVADEAHLAAVLAQISTTMPPLRGIIHAAGVLDDGILLQQTWERFTAVLRPKVSGAWRLHRLTAGMPLDFFVLFSSASVLLGSPGQGNYVAANSFLDALAWHRRALGLPALSIDWGAWSGIGFAADGRADPRMNARGISSIAPEQGLELLGAAMSQQGQIAVLPIQWNKFHAGIPAGKNLPFFAALVPPSGFAAHGESREAELLSLLARTPEWGRRDALRTYVHDRVCAVLRLPSSGEIDPRQPLSELGLDSLMAVELRNNLSQAAGRALPATLLFDYPALEPLTDYLRHELPVAGLESEPVPIPDASHTGGLAPVNEPIAIIGMACRFPGADSTESLWHLLRDGVDAITEIPPERWDVDAYFDPDPEAPGKMYTRWGGFLRNIEQFDADFFSIAPREAAYLDPQHRLLLEVTWEAIENAGQAPDRLAGSQTGVFVGISSSENMLRLRGTSEKVDAYVGFGNATAAAAGRLAYTLGLHGPAMSVDTACSSGLVALHLACQSLRNNECRVALAGGVNLILVPESIVFFSKARMMSPDGRCHTFDEAANGFVRGEGCGVVVLKRLSDALADGDNILGVVRGSAVNQDGRTAGLSAPNGLAQEAVIRRALADAHITPDELDYVEAHGTGTPLGDPIEVQSLGRVLGTNPRKPLVIGSVKTNFGHTEAAAGIAGLIKVLLSLQHEQIPPHLHLHKKSPYIAWDDLPLTIATALTPWQKSTRKRIAGISSFGFSGTNAHAVIEEAPPVTLRTDSPARPLQLLPLAAKTDEALRELAGAYAANLSDRNLLVDVAGSAAAGRSHFSHRLAVVSDTLAAAQAQLQAYGRGDENSVVSGHWTKSVPPRVAFLFTGQGSQYTGMCRELFDTESAFRHSIEQCDDLLRGHMDQSLIGILYPRDGAPSRIDRTAYTQPALFAIEYALAGLWKDWGIQPSAVMGHSVGEYVAAVVAGVFSLEDGLRLIARRGQLMQSLPAGGRMAAVLADAETVGNAIRNHRQSVSIAAVNGPAHVVISGEGEAIGAILTTLDRDGIAFQELTVSHAFHSALMDPMLADLERAAAGIAMHAPKLALVSNLTGKLAAEEIAAPAYWRRHAREPVRFASGIQALGDCDIFLEIGPSPVLTGMGRKCLADKQLLWLPSVRKGMSDWRQILGSFARMYAAGVDPDWHRFYGAGHRKVTLPTYPFQRERCWVDVERETAMPLPSRAHAAVCHPLLGQRLPSPLGPVQYQSIISLKDLPYLSDHRVYGTPLLPATGYMEMALAAASDGRNGDAYELRDVAISSPLLLDRERTVQCILQQTGQPGESRFELFSLPEADQADAKWQLHASGNIRPAEARQSMSLEAARSRCTEPAPLEEFYAGLRARGIEHGPEFRCVREMWQGDGETVGRLLLSEHLLATASSYRIHPALLDGALHVLIAAGGSLTPGGEAFVPTGVNALCLHRTGFGKCWVHARTRPSPQGDMRTGDVSLFDEDGNLLAEVEGVVGRKASRDFLERSKPVDPDEWLYTVEWRPQAGEGRVLSAEFLTSPRTIALAVNEIVPGLMADRDIESGRQLRPALDALSLSYIVAALTRMGFPWQVGLRISCDRLAQTLAVASEHQRLLGRLLDILSEDGLLTREGMEWEIRRLPERVDLPAAEAALASLSSQYPAFEADLSMYGRCVRHLAEVLRGQRDALQLLFPDGSLDSTEKLYRDSPALRVPNTLVREAMTKAIAELPEGRKLRILEVGAGTGGTTAHLLDVLPPARTEYVFTDVGPLFIAKARDKFAAHSFVRCELLDIERDPEPQGFPAHRYDIVLAANVLHATADLRRTLSHVSKLLAPGGLLILVEANERQRSLDLVFGLTEGWWKFQDLGLRPDYPLLSGSAWLHLLADAGFAEASAIAGQEQGRGFQGQGVFLAGYRGAAEANPPAPRGNWLVFSGDAVGERLAVSLGAGGNACYVVRPGAGYARLAEREFEIDPLQPADFERLLTEIEATPNGSLRGVVHLWNLRSAHTPEADADELVSAQTYGCISVLYLSQALLRMKSVSPALWLVTRKAQCILPGESGLNVADAPIWGLRRSILAEHPELRTVSVDLDSDSNLDRTGTLLYEEIIRDDKEDQVAFRQDERFVARLSKYSNDNGLPEGPVRLHIPPSRILDDLHLEPMTRTAPGPGGIEIRVRATALNFRDVLNALGTYQGDAGLFGEECAGEVVSIGEGVSGFAIGDAVLAMANASFSSFAIARAPLVARKPAHLSFEQAASLPVAFMTASYALEHLGRIVAGERVLIHAAAGGVGLAAVQLAGRAGAEIFATAGSGAKRDYLRSIGIQHVMDSRSLDFAREIRERTDGKGVDLVLNSLTGGAIQASLDALAPNGRFLEIGRAGIWESSRVSDVRPDVRYEVIGLDRFCFETPAAAHELLAALMNDFERGALTPSPLHVFSAGRAADGFRYMAQAKHIGKIVFTGLGRDMVAPAELHLRGDRAYLITGGMGGLGLLVAGRMVERGAKHLVLLGRSAPDTAAAAQIAQWEQTGASILTLHADVSSEKEMAGAFASIARSMPALGGLIHSAGLLDDRVLMRQSGESFGKVMAPKMNGAWILHRLTQAQPLDFFILFASAAGVLGSPGQANHAAANAFLDVLASYRRSLGLPAISIDWGGWADVGAFEKRNLGSRFKLRGLNAIPADRGLQIFERLFSSRAAHVAVLPAEWDRLLAQYSSNTLPPLLSDMVSVESTASAARAEASARDLVADLKATPSAARFDELVSHLGIRAARVLGRSAAQSLDSRRPLNELGLDSLMAVELRNVIGKDVGREIPTTVLFDYPTLDALAGYLLHDVLHLETGARANTPAEPVPEARLDLVSRLEQLSDEEVENMIAGQIAKQAQSV